MGRLPSETRRTPIESEEENKGETNRRMRGSIKKAGGTHRRMKGCPSETKGEPHRRMKGIHYERRGNPIENIGVPIRNQG